MKINSQKNVKKYFFNKCFQKHQKKGSNNTLSFMRLTDLQQPAQNHVSFDTFFYKDHVTLKKYSCQNLKKNRNTHRVHTQDKSDQKWRQSQNIKMINLIQYIDQWKSIKQNRNNILVYGNKKQKKQKNQSIKQNNVKQSQQIIYKYFKQSKQINRQPTARQVKFNNTQTILLNQNHKDQSQIKTILNLNKYNQITSIKSLQSMRSKNSIQNIITDDKCQNIGKLKRRLSQQIYKMNKVLLRDYLKQEKQYDPTFNYLIKNEESLQSKIKKMETLIQILQDKDQIRKTFLNLQTNEGLFHESDAVSRKYRASQRNLSIKDIQNSIKSDHQQQNLLQPVVHNKENIGIENKIQKQSKFDLNSQKNTRKQKRQNKKVLQNTQKQNFRINQKGKIRLTFQQLKNKHKKIVLKTQNTEQCCQSPGLKKFIQKMDKELCQKYRRQMDYSLNRNKSKKNKLFFIN